MLTKILRAFERSGYLRAASELRRQGYPEHAESLIKQAKEL